MVRRRGAHGGEHRAAQRALDEEIDLGLTILDEALTAVTAAVI